MPLIAKTALLRGGREGSQQSVVVSWGSGKGRGCFVGELRRHKCRSQETVPSLAVALELAPRTAGEHLGQPVEHRGLWVVENRSSEYTEEDLWGQRSQREFSVPKTS